MTTIVLAAGRSQRFGHANKLLSRFHGVPLIVLTLRQVLAATNGPVCLVIGHQARGLHRALARHGLRSPRLRVIYNRHARAGMAISLARGLASAPKLSSAVQIHLGDMPGVDRALVDRLRHALNRGAGASRPTYRSQPGHPMRLRRTVLPDRSRVAEQGLRPFLRELPASAWHRFEWDVRCVEDIDRRPMIRRLIRNNAVHLNRIRRRNTRATTASSYPASTSRSSFFQFELNLAEKSLS